MIRCAITQLSAYSDDPVEAQRLLAARAQGWIVDGIELIQLREKHLPAGDLRRLAETLVRLAAESRTRVLVNSRADVAIAAGAQGVHLSGEAGSLRPNQVRSVFAAAGRPRPLVSQSCHRVDEVQRAAEAGADLILFGPVYEKRAGLVQVHAGVGLEVLGAAVCAASKVPVLALGGVTRENAAECLGTGAAGYAAIREFA